MGKYDHKAARNRQLKKIVGTNNFSVQFNKFIFKLHWKNNFIKLHWKIIYAINFFNLYTKSPRKARAKEIQILHWI